MSVEMLNAIAAGYTQWAARSGQRADASEAITFARELLKVRSQLFEQRFENLKATTLMSRETETNETDEQFTYQTVSEYGTTTLGSAYGTNAPRGDVSMVEATPLMIKPITASYGYSFHEARISARLGRELPMRKARAARRAVAEEIDRILTYGDSVKYGVTLPGMLTQTTESTPTDTGVRVHTLALGASGSNDWSTKTPDEILKDLNAIAFTIVTASRDREHPNTMLLPLALYDIVTTRRLGDGSDNTILRHFLANSPYIKRVEPWQKLDAAPAAQWTGTRIMAYDNSADVLQYILPVEWEQFAPQMQGFETVVPAHARTGGVVVYRPKAICYADGA